jgi:hypothetical protein
MLVLYLLLQKVHILLKIYFLHYMDLISKLHQNLLLPHHIFFEIKEFVLYIVMHFHF